VFSSEGTKRHNADRGNTFQSTACCEKNQKKLATRLIFPKKGLTSAPLPFTMPAYTSNCRSVPMKHFICIAVVLLLFPGCLQDNQSNPLPMAGDRNKEIPTTQAAEVPRVIMLEGHDALSREVNDIGPKYPNPISVSFSPDGNKVVTNDIGGIIRIWCADSGKLLRQILPHGREQYIAIFSFFPSISWGAKKDVMTLDGKKIITTDGDTTYILDAGTGQPIAELIGDNSILSPDGKKLMTACRDGTVRIWDVDSGKEINKFEGHVGFFTVLAFSHDGEKYITSEAGTIRIRDIHSGEALQTIEVQGISLHFRGFLFDGGKIVTNSTDNVIRIWCVDSGKELQKIDGWGSMISLDGKRIVVTHDVVNNHVPVRDGLTTKIFEVYLDTCKEISQPLVHIKTFPVLSCFGVSPNGKQILVANSGGTVRLLDVDSGRELQKLELTQAGDVKFDPLAPLSLHSVSFSPNGKKIAVGGNYGYAAIWKLEE